jgi:hypothetical protein
MSGVEAWLKWKGAYLAKCKAPSSIPSTKKKKKKKKKEKRPNVSMNKESKTEYQWQGNKFYISKA